MPSRPGGTRTAQGRTSTTHPVKERSATTWWRVGALAASGRRPSPGSGTLPTVTTAGRRSREPERSDVDHDDVPDPGPSTGGPHTGHGAHGDGARRRRP